MLISGLDTTITTVTSKFAVAAPHRFTTTFTVPPDAIDELGHVSNLRYIAWMQEVAIQHSAARGWPVERYLQGGGCGWCALIAFPTCDQRSRETSLLWRPGLPRLRKAVRCENMWCCAHKTRQCWPKLKRVGFSLIGKQAGLAESRMICERRSQGARQLGCYKRRHWIWEEIRDDYLRLCHRTERRQIQDLIMESSD